MSSEGLSRRGLLTGGAALALAAAAPMAMPSNAEAQTAQVQQTSYSARADLDAQRWSRENPSGIGVGVALGADPTKRGRPERITEIVRGDFAANGFRNVTVFFEQNDAPATIVTFFRRGELMSTAATNGLYDLTNGPTGVRAIIPDVSAQVRFEESRPEFAAR